MQVLCCCLPPNSNLFPSPPPNPNINTPLPPNQLHLTKQIIKKPPNKPPITPKPPTHFHNRTKYYKPVSPKQVLTKDSNDRSIVVGDSGVSYLLPDAPFAFQFSYSETPKAAPVAIREPAFLPFAPPTMNRPWTGKAPLLSKKDKERKKKVRLFAPLGEEEETEGKVMRTVRPVESLGVYHQERRSREEIMGERLTRREVKELVKPHLSHNRQVNLGRDGLTHNMLELVHSHWRRREVCKVRCRGVPTVDMDNVCYHLEEKTGGKIIHRIGGIVYLFRGRHYNPRTRPKYPIMLWKPAAPVYPKLIQEAPEGLTKADANELRKKGQNLLPICKLAKNGIYIDLVKDVRDAFEGSHLVKVNCEGMHPTDYKKLGAKLKELVPCVLLSFDQEQILMWRGKDWKPRYKAPIPSVSKLRLADGDTSNVNSSGPPVNGVGGHSIEVSSPKMFILWKRALQSCKAVLLDETELSPDSLLKRVEEFTSISQASEHSFPALVLSSGETIDVSDTTVIDKTEIEASGGRDELRDYNDIDDINLFEEMEPSIPFGSLPVDSIAEQLHPDDYLSEDF